ncbi:MAG: hypothetical protein R3E84_21360 [Pseudomonadales bacterium]
MSLKLRLIGSLLTVLTTYAAADTSRDLTIVQRPIEQIEPAEQGEPDDPSDAGPLKVGPWRRGYRYALWQAKR